MLSATQATAAALADPQNPPKGRQKGCVSSAPSRGAVAPRSHGKMPLQEYGRYSQAALKQRNIDWFSRVRVSVLVDAQLVTVDGEFWGFVGNDSTVSIRTDGGHKHFDVHAPGFDICLLEHAQDDVVMGDALAVAPAAAPGATAGTPSSPVSQEENRSSSRPVHEAVRGSPARPPAERPGQVNLKRSPASNKTIKAGKTDAEGCVEVFFRYAPRRRRDWRCVSSMFDFYAGEGLVERWFGRDAQATNRPVGKRPRVRRDGRDGAIDLGT